MHDISVSRDIMEINRNLALRNRQLLDERSIFSVNVMGAVGSGKTSLIEALCRKIDDSRIGVIAGDVVSDIDAERLKKKDIVVVGMSTGKECHLDAHLIKHALEQLRLDDVDLLFIENVGNLICPVDFKLGEHRRVVITSLPEGDDKPHKYPAIFQAVDAVVINKLDLLPHLDFDLTAFRELVRALNPRVALFDLSCKTGQGIEEWVAWLADADVR